jgi:hypothetical protein
MSASSSESVSGSGVNNASIGYSTSQILWAVGIAAVAVVLVFLFKNLGKKS